MAKKAVRKSKIKMGNKTIITETNMFQPCGHIDYTGFGYHTEKNRKAERRTRKIEENRARFYGDDF